MVLQARSLENYQVHIETGGHVLIADEPEDVGDDRGPDPYGLLLASLAACTIMTVRMYAQRKEWDLQEVQVELEIDRIHARDCEDCLSDPDAKVDIIQRRMRFQGDLDEEQVERLLEIAQRCPLHRTLTSETKIRTSLLRA